MNYSRVSVDQTLRYPAGSLLLKQRNVETAIFAFEAIGVPLTVEKAAVTGVKGSTSRCTITAKDICNGHKEKTLALLWSIMVHWQTPKLIDIARLNKEIRSIRLCYPKCNAILTALETEMALTPMATPSADSPMAADGKVMWCVFDCISTTFFTSSLPRLRWWRGYYPLHAAHNCSIFSGARVLVDQLPAQLYFSRARGC